MRIKTVLLCFSLCITAFFSSMTNYAYAEGEVAQVAENQIVEQKLQLENHLNFSLLQKVLKEDNLVE